MTAWTVRQDPAGWSVHKDHRQHGTDLSSQEDALDEVRRRLTPRDTVTLVESDGYRTRITRQVRRRR